MRTKVFIVLGVLLSALFTGTAQAETFVGVLLENQQISTVEKYVEWLPTRVSYKSDEGNREWADPQTTLKRGFGDCKDYALLNREALKHLGYTSKIYSVTQLNQDKHAIAVFVTEGRYAFISNDELYLTDARTEDEFQRYLASQHQYFSPTEIN